MARHTDTLSPRDLFAHAYRLLADGGTLALIIPTDQADGFVAESIIAGFFEKDRVRIKTTESRRSDMEKTVENVLTVPDTHIILQPSLSIVPLQLFAYYVALQRGCDIDKPRNLAKSVTVE